MTHAPHDQRDESRTQGGDRLELIRYVQIAPTISGRRVALAYLLGINALGRRASAVRIEHYGDTQRRFR